MRWLANTLDKLILMVDGGLVMVTPWTDAILIELLLKLEKSSSHLREERKVEYTNPTFVLYFELTTAPRSHWRRWYGARRFSAPEQSSDWLAVFTWGHCLQEILCFLWSEHRTKPHIFIVKKWNKIQNIYQIYWRKYVNLHHEIRVKIKTTRFLPPDNITVSPGDGVVVTLKVYLMNFRW